VVASGTSTTERGAAATADGELAATDRVAEKATIGLPTALLVAWLSLGLASVLALVFRADSAPWSARLLRYAYLAGHTLVLGLVSAGAVWVFVRFGSDRLGKRRQLYAYALLFLVSLALSFTVLERDLSNLFASQEEAGSIVPWWIVAPFGVAIAITGAGYVAVRLSRPRLRFVPLAGGLVLAVFCQTTLLHDYRGVLFVANAVAALLISVGLWGVTLPRGAWSDSRARGVYRGALLLGAALAVASLVAVPRPSVWRSLFDAPGSLLAPYLARFRSDSPVPPAAMSGNAWFASREKAPSIPPSTPSLLPKNPIVVFITVDAVRGDLLATDKYAERLPNYTKIARESVTFTMARSPTPATLATITSLFTGKYYSQIYWTRPKPHIPTAEHEPTKFLAELLQEHGVHTAQVAVMGAPWKRGGSRGFDKIVRTKKSFASAEAAMDLILRELKRNVKKPRFLYSHFADPHYPYSAGKPNDSRFDRYVAEVATVDKQIGRLYRFLEKEKLLDRTVLVLSADHGEAFGEHGQNFHAFGNFDEVVHVPLIVHAPGAEARRVATPVSLIDMRPTILDLLGIPTPGSDMGQSLVPFLRGEDPVLERPIVVDAGRRIQSMVFPDNVKVTRDLNTRVVEVYDLKTDPGEHHDLADDPRYGQGTTSTRSRRSSPCTR